MQAADHVVRLDEIADPTAFLMGARIPLHHPTRDTRYEWIADMLLWRDPPLGWWEDVGVGPLQEGIAIDCTDPAVAAWADRKIAEAKVQQPIDYAELVIEGRPVDWVVNYKTVEGRWHMFAARKLVPATILPNSWNIPAARAALLRHLFGVKKWDPPTS